jgi:hypothetical protein
MTDAASALRAAAACFSSAICSSDLEESVEYAEAALAALPPDIDREYGWSRG